MRTTNGRGANRMAGIALFMLGAMTAVVLVTAVLLLFAIRGSQVRNTEKGETDSQTIANTYKIAKDTKRLVQFVNDCTDTTGKCFRRNAALRHRNDEYALALAYCADAPGQQTEEQLRRCASKRIGEQISRGEPSRSR